MKAISTLAIVAIVIIVIAAIGVAAYFIIHHPSSTTSSPITLTVVTFSGESAQFIQYAGELFHQLHPNVQVQVIQYPFSQ
ncbi:MAG: carbohydrate ABC transporter substrate-binding protein, partial [Saccharolobus sp.]